MTDAIMHAQQESDRAVTRALRSLHAKSCVFSFTSDVMPEAPWELSAVSSCVETVRECGWNAWVIIMSSLLIPWHC